MELQLIESLATLKKMAKKGLITLHKDTGKKLLSFCGTKKTTCFYIDDAPHSFQFGEWNEIYVSKYVSGCFHPFIFRVTNVYACFDHEGEFQFLLRNPEFRHKIDKSKYVAHFI